MDRLRSLRDRVREVPFVQGGYRSMIVAMLAAPCVVAPARILSGERIEHYFSDSFFAYSMVAACVGLLLFAAFRSVDALVWRPTPAERPRLAMRILGFVWRLLFVGVAIVVALFLAVLSLLRHPHDGDDFAYSDHFWESQATRKRFVEGFLVLPNGATSLRYNIAVWSESDGSGMAAQVVAEVSPGSLPEWTRGCVPTTRTETAQGLLGSDLPEMPPSARYFDCTETTGTVWTRRIVDEATRTAVILTAAR